MEYIDKLKKLFYKKGWSFRELGLRCALSESAVKNIIYKKCAPCVPSLEKLCAALDISLPELFCGEDKIVLKKSDETVVLSTARIFLPTEAKKHFLQFVKSLCEK